MRLGRKNLLYSMALAGVMMVFLVGYFIYMLPSLYVEHMMEQNLKSIYEQHKAYVETGSYENVRVKNVTACFSDLKSTSQNSSHASHSRMTS